MIQDWIQHFATGFPSELGWPSCQGRKDCNPMNRTWQTFGRLGGLEAEVHLSLDVMQLDGGHNQAKSARPLQIYDVVNGKGSVSLKIPEKSGVG